MAEIIDTKDMPIEEWLNLVFNPPQGKGFIRIRFPSDRHRDEYLAGIGNRSEEDVLRLLNIFLITSGPDILDPLHYQILLSHRAERPEVFAASMKHPINRRRMLYYSGHQQVLPWEGNTWVAQLLPHWPHLALQAIEAYFVAHAQFLSDERMFALGDAEQIIRAKFIGMPGTHDESIAFLVGLGSRTFECLVERLYHALGYKTELTPPQRDGGRDVIAETDTPGHRESLRIECKLYTGPVGVSVVRALLGVVSHEKATKGVLVTTGRFTKPAKGFAAENARLELIAGDQLIPLMNEYLGTRWPIHVERLVREAEGRGK